MNIWIETHLQVGWESSPGERGKRNKEPRKNRRNLPKGSVKFELLTCNWRTHSSHTVGEHGDISLLQFSLSIITWAPHLVSRESCSSGFVYTHTQNSLRTWTPVYDQLFQSDLTFPAPPDFTLLVIEICSWITASFNCCYQTCCICSYLYLISRTTCAHTEVSAHKRCSTGLL